MEVRRLMARVYYFDPPMSFWSCRESANNKQNKYIKRVPVLKQLSSLFLTLVDLIYTVWTFNQIILQITPFIIFQYLLSILAFILLVSQWCFICTEAIANITTPCLLLYFFFPMPNSKRQIKHFILQFGLIIWLNSAVSETLINLFLLYFTRRLWNKQARETLYR